MVFCKKALLVSTVSGFIPQFEMENVKILQNMGYEIHYASNYHTPSYGYDNHRLDGTGIIRHQVDFQRKPWKWKNIKAYFQLYRIIKNGHFTLVHCHTPMGGALTRIIAKQVKKHENFHVIYTAHGFHFYKGAPFINWLFYYPVEKYLSRFTDTLITINKEDYNRAKRKFYAKNIEYVPGVGINTEKFSPVTGNVKNKRKELKVLDSQILLLSVGELSVRKNHEIVIRAIKELNNFNIRYVICGMGDLHEHLQKLIEQLDLQNQVKLLGYREDITELCRAADLFVFPSRQEGLPVALMEAIACKTPVICSDVRGCRDLVQGCLFKDNDLQSFLESLQPMIESREKLHEKMACFVEQNYRNLKSFDLIHVSNQMSGLYLRGGGIPYKRTTGI